MAGWKREEQGQIALQGREPRVECHLCYNLYFSYVSACLSVSLFCIKMVHFFFLLHLCIIISHFSSKRLRTNTGTFIFGRVIFLLHSGALLSKGAAHRTPVFCMYLALKTCREIHGGNTHCKSKPACCGLIKKEK